MQMSPAKRRLSSPARTLMMSLGFDAAAVLWIADDTVRLKSKKEFLCIYFFTTGSI